MLVPKVCFADFSRCETKLVRLWALVA